MQKNLWYTESSMVLRICLSFAVLFFSSKAYAWSWTDAVKQAMEKNPTLQALEQAEDITELRWKNSKALMYPRVSLIANQRYFQNERQELDSTGVLGPRVEQLLYWGGKVRSGIKQAKSLQSLAGAQIRVESVDTLQRLREAFAQAIYAKDFLRLAQRIEQRRQENVRFTEIRYKSGLEYRWVFQSSKAKHEQAKLDALRASINQTTTLTALESLLGSLPIQSVDEVTEPGFYDDEIDIDVVAAMAMISNHPRVELIESRVAEARARIAVEKADFLPRIVFSADGGLGNRQDFGFFPYWVAGVSLGIPIFEAGRVRRDVKIEEKLLEQRIFELEQVKLNLKNEIQQSFQNFLIAKKQVEVSRLNLEVSEDRSAIVTNNYRSGVATFLEWENSQDIWVNAEVALLSDIRSYRIQRSRLEAAMGLTLGENL